MSRKGSFPPIAIVGRSCLLPGAHSPEQLWEAVSEGRDLLSPVPDGRWRLVPEEVLGPSSAEPIDRTWSDRGGYVTGFDELFNPSEFRVSADEIEALDPLFKWVLHTGRQALVDWRPGADTGRVSAILGNLSFPSEGLSRFAESVWLGQQARSLSELEDVDPRNRFMSGLPALTLARALGLGGGAFALDAACASSLYAIKLGCDRLHSGRADAVLAGAVNRADDLFIHMGFAALAALSKSGRSRPFHRRADGLVPAEGAGFVVLRRLEDAIADGDSISGVIRGIGLSNDGRSGGLLAPSEEGQIEALRRAYAVSGLAPEQISMLECHATGTEVGDAVELKSGARVFAAASDLPIGSLKSNIGHLITVAGVAGLIKITEAMRSRQRPPTLHADEPLDDLEQTPFRLLSTLEPWPSGDPRRAGLSAFGFGGNNAHLIVEEWTGEPLQIEAAPPSADHPVAIVGLGVRVGPHHGRDAMKRALFCDETEVESEAECRTDELEIALAGLRFPPNDLQATLAQQIMVVEAAREAVAELGQLPAERSAAIVGMGADPEVARYGARWRMARWARMWGANQRWAETARDAVVPVLGPAGVLGTMPNIPANRLNTQFDLRGPSFTVSAEEGSGLVALDLAADAVRSGEVEVALAAAVDLSCEPVHRAAAAVLPEDRRPAGDAAVAVVLKRLDLAMEDRDRILAVLADDTADASLRLGLAEGAHSLVPRFGCAHAAAALVHVAAAALAIREQRLPGGNEWTGPEVRRASIEVEAMLDQRFRTVLEAVPDPPGGRQPPAERTAVEEAPGPLLRLPGHPPPIHLPTLPSEGRIHPVSHEPVEPAESPVADPSVPQSMPPAPRLHVDDVERFQPVISRQQSRAPEPEPLISDRRELLLAEARAEMERVAEAHRLFMEEQARIHDHYMQVQRQAAATLVEVARSAESGPGVAGPTPAPLTIEAPESVPSSAQRSAEVQDDGFFLDRQGLEIHASGKISEIFGPLFEQQDGFDRLVRMPKPPLLLADRVVGLDAEPGSMGLGTIWTETDVDAESWYLHCGRMPAGVMIEAGQADLMLISYLGVDLLNRGERVYRLLGCELTYHGDLPRPGDTLSYDIHVDGHAKQGDVRLFFFHYDCQVAGAPRLTVRQGQAGFFSDQELADSAGVLWHPDEAEIIEAPRLDQAEVQCTRTSLTPDQIQAFAEGRPWQCFGDGFEHSQTHVRTPTIQSGKMLFLERITHLEARGGPWGRGYLRAVTAVHPDDWTFEGHFLNDPCMPGTLMFEGCLQAMALMMASQGFTLERDGWRFQPVPERPYPLLCRGQVTPESRELVYEIFVQEVIGGPKPTLIADLLCTVDGLKAFHGQQVGLELVPDWPLSTLPELLNHDDSVVAEVDGFRFDYPSLLASALGRPSDAFGPMYRPFDGPRRVARLPGPPYHFMSRVTRIDGETGRCRAGAEIELEYDIPPDAWYFDANGARTMPFCVLLEAALQPCGWLASYVGSALTADEDLSFRNLDGTGTLTAEVFPDSGTLRSVIRMTEVSRTGAMIIESFDVHCFLGTRKIYELSTVFGFFPQAALQNQVGLPTTDEQRALLEAANDFEVDLRTRPEKYCGGPLRLADTTLLMLDRVTGFWPDVGDGRLRAEKTVDPGEWFFKAHFFSDPVQPGSLGLEAMVQLLQFYMLETGMAEGVDQPRFEAIALDRELSWKYRGQVLPSNELVGITMDVTERGRDDRGPYAVADASLWVDGKRIYEATGLAMRVLSGARE